MVAPNRQRLLGILKEAIQKSSAKNYHGGLEVAHPLPPPAQQLKDHLNASLTALNFLAPAGDALVEEKDNSWKDACEQKFPWMRMLALGEERKVSPEEIAVESDRRSGFLHGVDALNRFTSEQLSGRAALNQSTPLLEPYKGLSWKELFVKLDLEAFLRLYQYGPDPEFLSTYVGFARGHVRGLVLPVLSKVLLPNAKEWVGPLIEALAPGLRTLTVTSDQVNPPDNDFFTALADALKANDHKIESFSLICAEKKEPGAAGLPFGAG